MNQDITDLSQRLDVIEGKLDAVLQMLSEKETNEWITRGQATELMSITDRQLTRLISSGVIHGNAIRNVGTIRSPRYRYHRSRLMNQYLQRAPMPH